jgi:hypothetical protein
VPRGARRILASLLRVACAAAPLCACALDVQTIRYPEAAGVTARPEGCEVRVVDWYRTPPASCIDLGDVYVGDRGAAAFSSGGCGRERVEREIRVAACQLGADLAMVRHLRELRTSCYQARARLLRCNAAEESTPR